MDILKLVEVETRLANLVFAQFLQQGSLRFQFAVQVENQVLFTGREADVKPVSLTRLATVMETAKADDCFPPHNSRLPGKLLHQIQHAQAIGASLLVGDAGKKIIDTGCILLCFQSHAFNPITETNLPSLTNATTSKPVKSGISHFIIERLLPHQPAAKKLREFVVGTVHLYRDVRDLLGGLVSLSLTIYLRRPGG